MVLETSLRNCETIGITQRNRIRGYLRSKSHEKLLGLAEQMSEQMYPDASSHYEAAQVVALIKKYPFPTNIDLRAEALKRFQQSEDKCRETNSILRSGSHSSLLARAAIYVERVLGAEPDILAILKQCSFGPGTSVGVSGNDCTFARKLLAIGASCSPSAVLYYVHALWANLHYRDVLLTEYNARSSSGRIICYDQNYFVIQTLQRMKTVEYNKVTSVPKTSLTDRTIGVEPLANTFIQKGVDAFMKPRLKRHGLDIRDQSLNQIFARVGSMTGSFATMDLSAASDTISIEVVRKILPPAWFSFLNSIRSPSYVLPSKDCRKAKTLESKRYEKFSSMGNGFTFPLETLIFASIIKATFHDAVATRDFLVYGDDIIVKSHMFESVAKSLEACGFTLNRKKTFGEGPFRESCGADWYLGVDVRPVVLDYALDSFKSIVQLHNIIKSKPLWLKLFGPDVLELLKNAVPEDIRLVSLSPRNWDSAFQVEIDELMTSPHSRYNHDSWRWRSFEYLERPISSRVRYCERMDLLEAAAVLSGSKTSGLYTLRRKTRARVTLLG